jgi:hypothetical protein
MRLGLRVLPLTPGKSLRTAAVYGQPAALRTSLAGKVLRMAVRSTCGGTLGKTSWNHWLLLESHSIVSETEHIEIFYPDRRPQRQASLNQKILRTAGANASTHTCWWRAALRSKPLL